VTGHRGHFLAGLGQALVVWLAVLVLIAVVRQVPVVWAGPGSALVACILLGQWHGRRARADSAVGAFAGAVLWPVLIGAVIITIGIVAESRSE
jgi:hypothetical protein